MAQKTKIVSGKEPIEFKSGNVIINKKSTKKFAKELSEINQSAGGNPIPTPGEAKSTNKTTTDAKDGGLLVGKSHDDGGMKAVVVDTGQPIEVEGGEAVIKKEAAQNHKEELTKINTDGGNGVPILKKGGDVPSTEKGAYDEELAKGIKVEKEHTSTIEKIYNHEITPEQAAEEIAKDHLKESHTYYSDLSKMESKFDKKGSGGKLKEKEESFYTFNVRKVSGVEGVIIKESDDGDDGFLMVLKDSGVFYNSDIFVEEKDYIIGGFTVEELDSVKVVGDNSKLGDIKLDRLFRDRIISHIESYKKSIESALAKKGVDTSIYTISERVNNELANLFQYLDIRLQDDMFSNNELLADEIIGHDSFRLWRQRITDRVNASSSISGKISNKKGKVSKEDAEEFTSNVTLQHILEQLSNIIENPDEH